MIVPMSEGMALTGRVAGSDAASMGSIRGGCVLSAGAGVGAGMDAGAGAVAGAAVAGSTADTPAAATAPGKLADETATAGGAATALSALAGNEWPHLGQNLASGLQTAWHCGQIFSAAATAGAAVTAASGAALVGVCLEPQRLQNLALAASALPH